MRDDQRPPQDDEPTEGSRQGDRIGPYRVERRLGMGGMGEVVLAYDERLDRRVAIKRIRRISEASASDRARFRREARSAAGLSHPAIVQVHDILRDGDSDAIVMEWVDGLTLADRLQKGPLPLRETLRLAREVSEGLAEAHCAGLVHRDLKAENVMVTPNGHAKILDFGLAKPVSIQDIDETLTRKGTLLGTVRTMSPEQAGGREADLEYRRGHVEEARTHLEELLRRAPTNTRGLGKLAQLELLYGDLSRAEQVAQRAIEIQPHRSYFTNLGLARFLLGRYEEAKTSYRQALTLDPGNLTVRLNLADVHWALGDEAQTRSVCVEIVEELETRDRAPTETMTMAQCLAYLGDAHRAVALTLDMLREHPEHAEVAYQAAVVYAVVGETASALVSAQRARERGVQPRWFEIPAFSSLRSDPRFEAVIATLP